MIPPPVETCATAVKTGKGQSRMFTRPRSVRWLDTETPRAPFIGRKDLDPAAVAQAADLLAHGGGTWSLPIGGLSCSVVVEPRGRCLRATVGYDGAPIVTMAVAEHSRCGAGLWRALNVTDRHAHPRAPAAPWSLFRVETGAMLIPQCVPPLRELSRALAWAWVDQINAKRQKDI